MWRMLAKKVALTQCSVVPELTVVEVRGFGVVAPTKVIITRPNAIITGAEVFFFIATKFKFWSEVSRLERKVSTIPNSTAN